MRLSHSSSVPARAALAGNPSDGHGGFVVATPLHALQASVDAHATDEWTIAGTDLSYASIDELSARVTSEGCGDVQPLVPAALAVLHRTFDAALRPHHIAVSTTIPRSVGLAGSSAIVIATMRTMIELHRNDEWAQRLIGDPSMLASAALLAETEVLGITAGLQDRVVQSFGATMAMDFSPGSGTSVNGLQSGNYRQLGELPGKLFVAYRSEAASDSGHVHAAVNPADTAVRTAMQRAADAGRAAAAAIDAGDARALGTAMDATFDQRAEIMSLEPAHIEMIQVARANGASANYTGSGGAVVVLAPDDSAADALRSLGCTLVNV